MRIRTICLLALAGVLVAFLATPATHGQSLSACVNRTNGQVRLVSSVGQCKPNETGVSWSVQGPAGPAGPEGPAGPAGPKGDPGPTASAFAHSTGGTTLTANLTDDVVIDLLSVPNTGSMEQHTGAITVDYDARLIATGTVSLRNDNPTPEGAYCWLALNPDQVSGGGPGTSFYYWGTPVILPANTFSVPLAVTDGIDVGPGTYNVGVVCWGYGVPNISTRSADLTVIATKR